MGLDAPLALPILYPDLLNWRPARTAAPSTSRIVSIFGPEKVKHNLRSE